MEQPRHDLTGREFEGAGPLDLLLDDLAQFGRQREIPAVAVLGLTRLQAQPSRVEIDMMPLPRENFRRNAPARYI
jgi:hypothetical protein